MYRDKEAKHSRPNPVIRSRPQRNKPQKPTHKQQHYRHYEHGNHPLHPVPHVVRARHDFARLRVDFDEHGAPRRGEDGRRVVGVVVLDGDGVWGRRGGGV